MELKDSLINNIIIKTENISKISSEIINTQDSLLRKMKFSLLDGQDKLAHELLSLASQMSKNNLGEYASRIEESVVNNLLNTAPYNAPKAYLTHKVLFAERHEMAMFLHKNLDLIKERVKYKSLNKYNFSSDKIRVFTYWDSEDNLPKIVSLCRESLKKYISSDKFELVILNKNNYKDWTDFRQENINADITQAHFTDLLCLKLLEKWGGFWLDATCLLTKDFYLSTQEIRKQEQFIFSYVKARTGTWFIYSKPNNYIISMVLEAINLWWAVKGYLTNYFMVHDVIEMLYWVDSEYQRNWDAMIAIHPRNALGVLRAYNQSGSEQDLKRLLEASFVHKLTYKYDSNNVIPNSILAKLIN